MISTLRAATAAATGCPPYVEIWKSVDPPKALLLCAGWRRGGHADTQVCQPTRVIADEPVAIQPVEVVAAQIAVGYSVPQNVPRGDQDGVAHGHDRLPVAPAARHAMILGRQVAIPRPHGASGTLNQRGAEPAVALARAAGLALAGTLVMAGTDAGPRGGLARRGKAAHVIAQFGHDLLGTAPPHAGNRVEALEGPRERPRLGLDADIEPRDLLVEELDVAQEFLQHEGVVVGHAAHERLPQLGLLLPQEALGQVGERLGVALSGDERL